MQEVGLAEVFAQIEEAFKHQKLDRVEQLLWPAIDQFPYDGRLWFYGGCVHFMRGNMAVASALFTRGIELDDASHMYSNLGAALRRLNLHYEGIHVLSMAVERSPEYPPALVNLGAMYVNEGTPEVGIPPLEKAVSIAPDAEGAIWNLGLLYLEAARFREGFDLYRQGVKKERAVRMFGFKGKDKNGLEREIPEPRLMDPEEFAKCARA